MAERAQSKNDDDGKYKYIFVIMTRVSYEYRLLTMTPMKIFEIPKICELFVFRQIDDELERRRKRNKKLTVKQTTEFMETKPNEVIVRPEQSHPNGLIPFSFVVSDKL